jgi:hypothetical protein
MNELTMNECQEAILDALMVAEKLRERFKPQPLVLALEALQHAGLTKREDPGAALGYPPLLCAAVGGTTETITETDDCRAFAISLFTEVAPRPAAPKLTSGQLVAAAVWSARQVPPFCEPRSRLTVEVVDVMEEYLGGRAPHDTTIERLSTGLSRDVSLVEAAGPEFTPRRLALTVHYFALHTLRRTLKGQNAADNAALVARDAARLAGLVRGVAGAVPYCVGLARQLGM